MVSPAIVLSHSPSRWTALALIVAAQFMVVVDLSIVNVALATIKDDLHFSQASLQWVVTAYAIVFGGFLLLGGRLADLLGRRRIFIAGISLFTLGSVLSGLAWSAASLVVFRGVQGLGGALFAPAGLSLLMTLFRAGRERNVALGIWGAASGAGGAVGVLLGGVLLRTSPGPGSSTSTCRLVLHSSRLFPATSPKVADWSPSATSTLPAPSRSPRPSWCSSSR